MTTLYDNFLAGTITDNPLTSGATTINSAAFVNLPVVASPDIMYLVLDADSTDGAPETVTVTTHTASATSITVTRGSQGSTARAHVSGTDWIAAWTKADADQLATLVTEWVPFTPSWVNVTLGTGPTNTGEYIYTQDGIRVRARLILGTGGAPTGSVSLTIPNSESMRSSGPPAVGSASYKDAAQDHDGHCRCGASGTTITLYSGTNDVTATNPFTFDDGDQLMVDIVVPR